VETRYLVLNGAIVCAAIALLAMALAIARKPVAPVSFASGPDPRIVSTDPLAPELHRCKLLGEAAERDNACLAVWDHNRRRFLGEER
jgi:conjugative transfer region protein TrbK